MRVQPCLTLIDHKEHNILHFRKFLIHPEIHQKYLRKRYASYPNYFFSLLSVFMEVNIVLCCPICFLKRRLDLLQNSGSAVCCSKANNLRASASRKERWFNQKSWQSGLISRDQPQRSCSTTMIFKGKSGVKGRISVNHGGRWLGSASVSLMSRQQTGWFFLQMLSYLQDPPAAP